MIEVRGAHKELGQFSLRGVDLVAETGEYFVVLGPTGAGKTVLLECIAGLHRLDSGAILLHGRDVTNLPPELRNVGYVPQDYVLFPHISLRANIEFSLTLRRGLSKAEIDERVHSLTSMLRIEHLLDRRPRTLSGGEQQRGALARALAPRPTLLLLDEPLSALDEGTRAELAGELGRISTELKTTVIHVCHNFDEALELGDRIAVIRDGQVVQVGPPGDVLRKPNSEFLAHFVGCVNLFPVASVDRSSCEATTDGGVVLRVASVPSGERLLATVRPEDISVRRAGAESPSASPANRTEGRLAKVDDRGRVVRLHIEGRLPLTVTLTRQAFLATGVASGDLVEAVFSPSSVHLLEP